LSVFVLDCKESELVKRRPANNNLTTVQKIAYLLGENASETETVLSTIIDSFKEARAEGRGDDE
jgi:hypothetical protein